MQSLPTIEPSGKSFSKINGNINEIINYFLVRKKRNEINYVTFSQEHMTAVLFCEASSKGMI